MVKRQFARALMIMACLALASCGPKKMPKSGTPVDASDDLDDEDAVVAGKSTKKNATVKVKEADAESLGPDATKGTGTETGTSSSTAVEKPAPPASNDPPPNTTPPPNPALEARQRFVAHLYMDVLGRQASAGEIAAHVANLEKGLSRRDLAMAFLNTPEGSVAFLKQSSLLIFVRDLSPDPAWQAQFLPTGTFKLRQIFEIWVGSPEFFAASGSTMKGFTNLAFVKVLGRQADPGGLTFWSSRPRAEAAHGIVYSQEAAQRLAESWYQRYLGRGSSAVERDAWARRIMTDEAYRTMVVDFLASDEYFGKP